jgi:hypothetical protein
MHDNLNDRWANDSKREKKESEIGKRALQKCWLDHCVITYSFMTSVSRRLVCDDDIDG